MILIFNPCRCVTRGIPYIKVQVSSLQTLFFLDAQEGIVPTPYHRPPVACWKRDEQVT